ncbi:multidrug effflux MFS transporter [Furfurilactobacillus siliginis]|uniref:Bcr/CflA family efflux transporter n=1 Tax=Furfurilactobacillus siliginis TaxID=348151 RepID=A0A0R2LDG0_9LACO|nr:multidrug effflux MFS transporter [Furfurilactobacillus siliginis]KRN97276.1 major facilitator superfamily permease [Furfurilactobacillus siliginis]GEK28587.1 Bcr/CflA family drug resistance efflux transporter [Furfurilactobacillus siliginis]
MKNVRHSVSSILIIICLVGFPQISESIFTPSLPALSQALMVSAKTSQLTMSSYFIAFAIGVVFWGWLSDRFGRRPAMLLGIAVYFLGNIGLLLAPSFGWLLLFRLAQSFGASSGSVVTQTIMRESFYGVRATKVFAAVTAAMALSPALGPLIGGLLQTYYGYKSVFSFLIIMAVSLLLYAGFRLPETRISAVQTPMKKGQFWTLVKRLLTDKTVWVYAILISGINGILFSYYAEAPFIFIDHFKLTPITYGTLGLALAFANIFGAITVNRLIMNHTAIAVTRIGLTTAVIGSVLLVGASVVNQFGWMVLFIFVVFYGLNITLPMALQLALVGYGDVIGLASGLFSFGYYLLISLLTYLMSALHTGAITVLPVYILVLVIIMLLGHTRIKE